MPTWRLMLLSLLLCTTWLGCSDDADPTPDSGTMVDAGRDPADSGTTPTDSGTAPTDSGTDPADSGSDAGTDPADSGTDPVDGGPSGGDAGTDAGTADNSVRIRRFTRYRTASGFEERPADFTRSPVELFRVEGDALVSVPGAAGGPGEYVFPDVPQASYYLKVGTTYIVTAARELDLSVNELGRADAELLPNTPDVSLKLQEVEAWVGSAGGASVPEAPSSQLQLSSEELGIMGDITPDAESGQVELDALTGMALFTGPMKRFEQVLGDRARVVQLSPQQLGALPDGGVQGYVAAVRTLHLPPFFYDASEAPPILVEGTLQPLPQNEFPLDWRVSAFAAHAPEVNPSAELRASGFDLHPAAYGLSDGWVGYSGSLITLLRPLGFAGDAVGTLQYGNPYPSSWGLLGQVSTGFAVQAQLSTGARVRLTVSTTLRDEASRLADGPIVPRVSPPRSLTLDGTEAYSARTLSAGAHVVAWQPPSSGRVDAYVVTLRRRDASSGFPTFVVAANFYLDESTTSVRLPAELFQPDQAYYVTVRAVQSDGYDVTDWPLTLSDRVPYSDTPTMSGLLSVPAPAP